ncbi:hypothetical protein [Candidatus Accumulibacter sp. ACC012]|uniref:hypothetical protein n=1 Tax=Candidatus Accumulibacter sp. ACC012 TaxID=2823332 RepID=UPI0025BDEE4F|nr:hypothetical protein [Candidatus Accumulibacter sp. ACC012]
MLPSYLDASIMLVVLASSALILIASYQVNHQVPLAAAPPLPAPDDEALPAAGDAGGAQGRAEAGGHD